MLNVTITNEQKIKINLNPVSAAGKPAKVDGAPTWEVGSGDVKLDVAKDGLSAFIISPDVPGLALVNVEADADLGAGVETVHDAINVTIEGAKATSLGLAEEPAVPKEESPATTTNSKKKSTE